MKKITLLIVSLALLANLNAQKNTKDTVPETVKRDTVRIGGILIITKKNKKDKPKEVEISEDDNKPTKVVGATNTSKKKKTNVTTNWITWDFGFNNYTDNTNYTSAATTSMLRSSGTRPAPGAADLKVSTGKSINVNFWLFMQRFNIVKRYVGLKYGLGLELNNYRYTSNISFINGSPSYIIKDSVSFSKNKLAVNYITVPLMLTLNPSGKGGFSISGGISAGYRYSSFNKQKSGERGKDKTRGDHGLNPWKLAIVGDIGYNRFRLFGSYSLTPLHEKGLDFTPYSVGIRLNRW